ncbi:MAG: M56 family metallopeptidase [Anaerolineae bacterium]|nr:M56 family metallopeptidase [Anaerolineae bacterium]
MNQRNVYLLLVRLFILMILCVSLVNVCGALMGGTSHSSVVRHILFVAGVLLLGLGVFIRQVWRTSRFVKVLIDPAQVEFSPNLAALFTELDLHHHIVLTEQSHPFAFCFGFLRPRICLSTGLVQLLRLDQLKAVLLHEDHHRQHFDPLRMLLIEVMSTMFFFLPIIRAWGSVYKVHIELRADEYAIGKVGKLALAGALHQLFTDARPAILPSGASIAGLSASTVRVAALLSEQHATPYISPRTLWVSTAVLWLICLLLML